MTYISGFDRSQTALFPATVEEMIDQNNVVRLIEIFINGLDLKKFGFAKAVLADEGRPGYDPADYSIFISHPIAHHGALYIDTNFVCLFLHELTLAASFKVI